MKWNHIALLTTVLMTTCIAGCGRTGEEPAGSSGEAKPAAPLPKATGEQRKSGSGGLTYGAETPQALLTRIAAALKNKDRAEYLSCLHPPTATEAQKAEAEKAADLMFTCLRARELLEEVARRFEKQQLNAAVMARLFPLTMLATAPTMFEQLAEDAEIEVQGSKAVIQFKMQTADSAPRLQGGQAVHQRDDGRWYYFNGDRVDNEAEASASVKRAKDMVAALEKALAASKTIEQFREQIVPLEKGLSPKWESGRVRPVEDFGPALLSPQASRDAVMWAVSVKATASVQFLVGGRPVLIRRKEDIPDEEFQVVGLKLRLHRELTQDDFRRIGEMKDLRSLDCFAVKSVTDSLLPHLSGLKKLESLDLRSTHVTGAGFEHLKSLEGLRHVELGYSGVNDAGLSQIAKCRNIDWLELDHTEVTDAGLAHLKSLNRLLDLDVTQTQVTAAGVATLEKALPNCDISPRDRQELTGPQPQTKPPWLALNDTSEVSDEFFRWLFTIQSLDKEEREILIEVFQRKDAERLLASPMPRVIDKLNALFDDGAADAALQLAEDSQSLVAAGLFEFYFGRLRGGTPAHKQGLVDLMWKWLTEEAILRPPPFKSIEWFPSSRRSDPQFLAKVEPVAANPKTAFQGKAVAALIKSDFEKYFAKLEPQFAQFNTQAQLEFATNAVGQSKDKEQQNKYRRFVIQFVKLEGDQYDNAKREPTFLAPDDNRVEYIVVRAMHWLNRQARFGFTASAELRREVEAATLAGLKRICAEDDDAARRSTFSGFMYDRSFFKQYAEAFPDLVQWGVASNDPIVLRKVLSLGEEIDSDVVHDRALELVKSDNQRLVNEGLNALGEFKRPDDAKLLIALLDNEKLVNQAVLALDNFEPLHVEQFARLLDHPNLQVRHNAYMALRELPGGKDLKFNTNATGDEIAQEKQKIIDWLKEKGHLKGDD